MVFENQTFTAKSGNDEFALQIGPVQRPALIRNCTIDGANGDWGLKSAKSFDAVIEDCIILNGIERALDMVRGGNIVFRRCKFINDLKSRKRIKSKYQFTKTCDIGLKSGIRDVRFEDCSMNDLLLGDYSIYDQINRPKTRRISLSNCANPNGGPIIVRGRYAEKVIVENGTQIDQFIWPKFVTSLYWWFNRKFGDKRKLKGEQAVLELEELL